MSISGALSRITVPDTKIFRPRDASILLLLPIPFFILTAMELAGWLTLTTRGMQFAMFICSILLLNITHQALTLSLLFLPELKAWVKERDQDRRIGFYAETVLVHLGLSVAFYFAIGRVSTRAQQTWIVVLALILQILPSLHSGLQYSGFASIFGHEKAESGNRRRYNRLEEKLLYFITGLTALPYFIVRAKTYDPDLIFASKTTGFVICAIALLWLFYRYTFCWNTSWTKKAFLTRALFFPLGLFSNFAYLATISIHGIDYFFLNKEMWRRSKMEAAQKKTLLWIVLLYMVFLTFACSTRVRNGLNFLGWFSYEDFWVRVVLSISLGFTVAHYYLDNRLFRMSDELNRKHIRPLMS